jgi:hypothetical protein
MNSNSELLFFSGLFLYGIALKHSSSIVLRISQGSREGCIANIWTLGESLDAGLAKSHTYES